MKPEEYYNRLLEMDTAWKKETWEKKTTGHTCVQYPMSYGDMVFFHRWREKVGSGIKELTFSRQSPKMYSAADIKETMDTFLRAGVKSFVVARQDNPLHCIRSIEDNGYVLEGTTVQKAVSEDGGTVDVWGLRFVADGVGRSEVTDRTDVSDTHDRRVMFSVETGFRNGGTIESDVMYKPDTGLMYIVEGEEPSPLSEPVQEDIFDTVREYLKGEEKADRYFEEFAAVKEKLTRELSERGREIGKILAEEGEDALRRWEDENPSPKHPYGTMSKIMNMWRDYKEHDASAINVRYVKFDEIPLVAEVCRKAGIRTLMMTHIEADSIVKIHEFAKHGYVLDGPDLYRQTTRYMDGEPARSETRALRLRLSGAENTPERGNGNA